jgi:hypothetical protein
MSTPGRRRALKALARAKKRNAAKARRGQSVTIGGRKLSAATYRRRYGTGGRRRRR